MTNRPLLSGDEEKGRFVVAPLQNSAGIFGRFCGDSGQATTEYTLVLIVAAVIAVALVSLGPDGIKSIFETVIERIKGYV